MHQDEAVIKIRPIEAFILTLLILGGISYAIIFAEAPPHVPVVLSIIALIIYGMIKKVSFKEIEAGVISGAKSGIGAVFLFFFIGMLISSWMASGTIPTFIYYALQIVDANYFYAICFIVSSIIGISIGSSLTTAATIGVAFMGVSSALGLSDAITAGAIISGAFFGDKMSPLSDTTNLASMTVGVDLFEHIKNMSYTTIPVFIMTLIAFIFLSPTNQTETDFSKIEALQAGLIQLDLVQWYALIPFLILTILAIKKIPAIITLSAGVLSAVIISFFVQSEMNLKQLMAILFNGYVSNTGTAEIDSLLTRGGMESMFFSISLVMLTLAMGGLFVKLGILNSLLEGIKKYLVKTWALITTTAGTAIGINFMLGEQYLSILLTGNTYKESYKKAGLHPKNLARVLEDSGTVINPLVPWSICGVFMTTVLGVETLEYLPFALFCLLSPIVTIIYGITGWTIKKLDD
ncbi:Na+:H+ antiporter, NhaC family [Cytobacillus horneckiae]|uniref:Na+/H+ antiporter NhaC n=1 Tax=Cytobacillus horneckiae TaxID=549687 RepID=A0A2N0Z8U4_9BACI|nr:Na+/H+ antiporter NhaC [Cytobacillus horneckiae]MBN6889272.1 Na+/H+ antiporter NhaC [Cytobacillus horneckiae]MEC1156769.1 Na+/H+ antiporter NhaC [Cytobacillus horneckiae]MED2940529.1 Na+/H+ antiporter NhaC [Cytobacillus horneckiae]PKG25931.1 Na+/H+ antiporter NhaC [Cytobacillus horneckiae]